MTDRIWERRADETDKAFAAFKIFLEMQDRSCEKVAKRLHKTPQHIRRWAARYDWRARVQAWEDSLIQDLRADLKRELAQRVKRQWLTSTLLQEKAFAALEHKDLTMAGFRTLNEIYNGTAQIQLKLIEMLKLTEATVETDSAKDLTINIVPVTPAAKD